jgi:hypothetical protein
VDSAEAPAASDDAFDFFDDEEGARDLPPAQSPVGDIENLEFKSASSDFSFGDDDLSVSAPSLDQGAPVTPEVAPLAEAVEITEASPVADAAPQDAEPEQPPSEATSAVPGGDDPDDSLAPDASRSGDQPFDFAIAEDVTDPLADLDPVPPVDPSDFAQATVIDPLGASGYDVSSSDLGPPMTDTRPDPPQVAATRADEAEMTRLAPETPPDPNAWPVPTPMTATPIPDDLTTVAAEDPMDAGLTPPPQAEPVAITAEDHAPAVLAAELYSEPDPAEAPAAPAASPAEPVNALLAAIEPELRQQLHDTLEKIAWESFGDLTDTIVRQTVERVEKIAWEVIPRMAETLIEEEIRRMKAESEDS